MPQCAANLADLFSNLYSDSYDIPDSRYGGYDPVDKRLAEDLARNLTGQESCLDIADAINVLENRIRGRRENIDEDFCGNGDEGHEDRITNLEEAKTLLEDALRNGKCI